MAPRRRNLENRGLPTRWRIKGKTYYYQVPKGSEQYWNGQTEFRLGSSLEEAHRTFAKKLAESTTDRIKTVGELLDKYLLIAVPEMSVTTQRVEQANLKILKQVFADVFIDQLEPIDLYRYFDKRSAKVSAKREVGVMKNAFQYAVQWGYIRENPLRDVKVKLKKSTGVAKRYVTDDEILTVLNHTDTSQYGTLTCQGYIRLKLLTGLRKADMLRLTMSNITDEGLFCQTGKSNKPLLFTWTPTLKEVIEHILATRPVLSQFLFCTRRGECMINEETGRTGAFDSLWKDFLMRVKEKNSELEHFTEHDLRGKVGSDAETDERAAQLLGHSTTSVTRKHYRRKVASIKPAK